MRLNLKTAVLRSGFSQRRIAAVCGVSETRLSSIVRGWVSPRADEEARIASYLNADPDRLFDVMQPDPITRRRR